MKILEVKDIFSEAWQQFKTCWLKLTIICLCGYLLPALALYALAESTEGPEDCAPCALVMLVIFIFICVGYILASLFIKSYLRAFSFRLIFNRFDKTIGAYTSIGGFGIIVSKGFIFSIGCIMIVILYINLGKTVDVSLYQNIFFILVILCIIIPYIYMFVPFYLMDNRTENIGKSLKESRKLLFANYKIVIATTLTSFLLDIILWSTIIGISVAIPFKVFVTCALYKKINQKAIVENI